MPCWAGARPLRLGEVGPVPTLIIFLLMQKQFVAGLTLGSAKG